MQLIKYKLITILILFILIANIHAQSVNVPLTHWAYNFLERLEARGFFPSLLLRAKPISRHDLAGLLVQIEKNKNEKKMRLSKSELELMDQLKGEFHEELAEHSLPIQKKFYERHFLKWDEDDNKFRIDLDFAQRFETYRGERYDSTRRISHTTAGAIIRGNLSHGLAFYLHFKNTLVRGEGIKQENFNPQFGLPVVTSGENAFRDDAIAYFIWQMPWFDFEFGRDQAQWGPGFGGSLLLSRFNPPFDLLKIRAQFNRFYFTSLHGKLTSNIGNKYLAAHRLEFRASNWLCFAGSESVIYGNRQMEFSYINPIMPYHIAEHHLGDRDNNMMAFEMTLFPVCGLKFYSELLLDDFTLAENPFTYYGNKFAFQTGYFWVNPLGLANLAFRTEYTRIEPYVYTHYEPINVYQNYNQSIGHWLGPNSDQLYCETEWLINRELNVKILAERLRHGAGNINTPHKKEDGRHKSFLAGVVETKWRLGFDITDQIMRDFFLTLQYHVIDTDNLDQVAGRNSRNSQIIIELSANW